VQTRTKLFFVFVVGKLKITFRLTGRSRPTLRERGVLNEGSTLSLEGAIGHRIGGVKRRIGVYVGVG